MFEKAANKIANMKPHKKWLASAAIFLSTSLIPTDLGIIAMFVDVPALGNYTAEVLKKEDFHLVLNEEELENQ